jgi:homoserine kinase
LPKTVAAKAETPAATTTPAAADPWAEVEALDALLKAEHEAEQAKWLALQAERLAKHPDEIACAIPGCTGTVQPEYQRTIDGRKVGYCPRTKAHTYLRNHR